MKKELRYRAFVIEVLRADNAIQHYVKAKRQDGSLIHEFDIDEAQLYNSIDEAIEAGREIIDNFLNN